jgi:predicted RNA polymerase sigma factor
MHLCNLLLEHPLSATPESYALAALMCLDAVRLPARVDASGNLSSLCGQDRSLRDAALIARGDELLDHSATGTLVSEYHIEAAIADSGRLADYPFYFAALAELELQSGRKASTHEYFLSAQSLARNPMERRFFEQRASACAAGLLP